MTDTAVAGPATCSSTVHTSFPSTVRTWGTRSAYLGGRP